MNVQGIILKLLLKTKDKNEALERFSALRSEMFDNTYGPLLSAISKFYSKHERMPSLEELLIEYSRNNNIKICINALEAIDISFCDDYEIAFSALHSEFAQTKYLNLVEKGLDKLSMYSAEEIVDHASTLALSLEEIVKPKTHINTAASTRLFKSKEERESDIMKTGISDTFDNEYGAIRRGEVFLIGGKRGAGKSLICSNICNRAYSSGFIAPYFSLEMKSSEVFARSLAILSKVPAIKIRNADFSKLDLLKLADAKAAMFTNGKEILDSLDINNIDDYVIFEDMLEAKGVLTPDRQILIIDDLELRLSALDMYLSKLKSKYGDKLGPVIVDYLNQLIVDGHETDMYDWKVQIYIAKSLKNLARKHGVAIFSPYQIDDNGQARMSRGILDSCDFAFTVEAIHGQDSTGYLKWSGTKARGLPVIDFNVAIDWDTLLIDPRELTSQDLLQLAGGLAKEEDISHEL